MTQPPERAPAIHDEPLLLTVAQAAGRLGVGRSLLYELLMDGTIESVRVGRLRRIPANALTAYVEGLRVTPVRATIRRRSS